MRRPKNEPAKRCGRLRRGLAGKIHLLWVSLFYFPLGLLHKQGKATGLAQLLCMLCSPDPIFLEVLSIKQKYWESGILPSTERNDLKL